MLSVHYIKPLLILLPWLACTIVVHRQLCHLSERIKSTWSLHRFVGSAAKITTSIFATFTFYKTCWSYLSQDAKPGDVGNKRGMWETKKSPAPAKVTHTCTRSTPAVRETCWIAAGFGNTCLFNSAYLLHRVTRVMFAHTDSAVSVLPKWAVFARLNLTCNFENVKQSYFNTIQNLFPLLDFHFFFFSYLPINRCHSEPKASLQLIVSWIYCEQAVKRCEANPSNFDTILR